MSDDMKPTFRLPRRWAKTARGFALALALCLGAGSAATLQGCSTLKQLAPQSSEAVVFDARASYDAAVLVPLAHYSGLPDCPAQPACAKPDVLRSLIKADHTAEAAFDAAEDIVRNHPDLDAATAIRTMQNAVALAETIITTYGVK